MIRTKNKPLNPSHEKIISLRKENYSYNAIAEMMGLSRNTVQSICQRAGVKCTDIEKRVDKEQSDNVKVCKYCGELFVNPWNRKGKVFCSDKCRTNWWNEQRKYGGGDSPN